VLSIDQQRERLLVACARESAYEAYELALRRA
jgi:hypothetical protein